MAGEIRNTDIVKVALSLKARDRADTLEVNEVFGVDRLGVDFGALVAKRDVPQFDHASYVRLIQEGRADEAAQFMAGFHKAAVERANAGNVVPSEVLANAVVDYLVAARPRGQTIVKDDRANSGYILTTKEITLTGPTVTPDGDRIWKVTAVGTWGK